jgi:hypothetical protein
MAIVATIVTAIITAILIAVATVRSSVVVVTSIWSTVVVVLAQLLFWSSLLLLLVFLVSRGTPRAHYSCSHSLMVCLASQWNWYWSSMTMLKSPSRKVEGLGGSTA